MGPVTGLIFDIKRYAIHDGPGIRSTVFLKGCPLSCDWCQNPESRDTRPELMFSASRCIRCGTCVEVCPNATDRSRRDGNMNDRARCKLCGECVEACPSGARSLVGQSVSVQEVIAEVGKDRLFFDESGGGVTFSGGEPLMQAEFVSACLQMCRRREYHTALDTCGHAPGEVLLACAAHADLILYDLKLIDAGRHERHIGVSNSLILENLQRLDRSGGRIWVRVPVIPGVNDDQENLSALRDLVSSLQSRPPVQLLPYHRAGGDKCDRLGVQYALAETERPTHERMVQLGRYIGAAGLEVRIGG